MNQEKVGKFIVKLRKEKNMTQEDLAKLLFVDRTAISKWERGENNINIDVLIKLSEIFDITVNEILIGERKTKDNIDKLNTVTIDILKKNKKFRKYLVYSCSFIAILLLTFLLYYFVNTYNSIMVYEINGENKNFSIHNGLIIISKDKFYIQLGNVKSLNSASIVSVKLNYKKGNKVINLYEVNDSSCFYQSTYQDSQIQYSDIKYLISNMFLEVESDNGEIFSIKLKLIKSYSNNKFFQKNTTSLEQEEINDLNSNIPIYIKEKFNFNEDQHSYYFEEVQNNKKIKYTYFYDVNVYIVEENNNEYMEKYIYSYPDDISYSRSNNKEEIIEEFVYSISTKECITGKCNNEVISYFSNQYLKELQFE